jgi:hypothetical protein
MTPAARQCRANHCSRCTTKRQAKLPTTTLPKPHSLSLQCNSGSGTLPGTAQKQHALASSGGTDQAHTPCAQQCACAQRRHTRPTGPCALAMGSFDGLEGRRTIRPGPPATAQDTRSRHQRRLLWRSMALRLWHNVTILFCSCGNSGGGRRVGDGLLATCAKLLGKCPRRARADGSAAAGRAGDHIKHKKAGRMAGRQKTGRLYQPKRRVGIIAGFPCST